MKSGRACRLLLLLLLLPRLGGNFPISVAIRKSITALSHFSMESSSETCTCRHLPALHPVAFPTSFQSVFCWSLHRLQWRKRCSRVTSDWEGKVLAKQKQRDKSTTTIAIKKRTAAIDSRRQIDPGASVPAPARPQEEGAHRNPHNGVGSRKGLGENATDMTRRPTSKR